MNNSTNTNPITTLAAELTAKNGRHTVFIAESEDDSKALERANVENIYIDPQYYDTQAQLYSMLQNDNMARKTIIVFPLAETERDWIDTIRNIKATTTAEIEIISNKIADAAKILSGDMLNGHARDALKAIKTYADQVEEQANPKPGNVLEYLTGGKYSNDLDAFRQGADVRTGFNALDQKIGGGLYAGLYVLGAVPTLGKTTYALQLADQIAEQHKHVLFFSMEQSRLELVTKSISRTGRKMNPGNQTNLKTSLQIRKGYTSNETETALEYYKKNIAPYMNIIEGNFMTTADTIRDTVDKYIKRNNARPVVIIDYLQILQPIKGSRATDPRTLTDQNITALKRLSRDCEVPVIAISSFNRMNYKQTVDYESFKETSGIEYTADVLLGMEYDIISALDGKNPNSDRDRVNQAKAAPERKIKLKCLKNRYGMANFEINMKYYPRFDYFTEDTINKKFSFDDVQMK